MFWLLIKIEVSICMEFHPLYWNITLNDRSSGNSFEIYRSISSFWRQILLECFRRHFMIQCFGSKTQVSVSQWHWEVGKCYSWNFSKNRQIFGQIFLMRGGLCNLQSFYCLSQKKFTIRSWVTKWLLLHVMKNFMLKYEKLVYILYQIW